MGVCTKFVLPDKFHAANALFTSQDKNGVLCRRQMTLDLIHRSDRSQLLRQKTNIAVYLAELIRYLS